MATTAVQNFIDTTQWGAITEIKGKKDSLYNEERDTFAVLYRTLFARQTRLFKDGREIHLMDLIEETAYEVCKTKALAERAADKTWIVYGRLCTHLNSRNQLVMDMSISPSHRKLAAKKADIKAICPRITNREEWQAIFKIFDKLAIIKQAQVGGQKCFLLNFLYHATKTDYSMEIIKSFWEYNRMWLKQSIKKFLDDFFGDSIKERDINDSMIMQYMGLQPEDIAPMEESQAG